MAQLGLPRAYFDEIERQIERLPDGVVGPPLEPVTLRMTRAERAERRAAHQCFRALCQLAQLAGLSASSSWWIEIEPDVRLPGDLLGVPDVAAWRIATGEPFPLTGPVPITPTLCCKVISSDTAKNYRDARLPFYARAGVHWFWLIDPVLRSVEVLENAGGELVAVREAKGADEPSFPPFDKPFSLASFWVP